MLLEIITPDKSIYSGHVKLIQLPGNIGSFEIENNHAPIISILDKGKITPELLTDDADMQDRIRRHPLLEWKAVNVREFKKLKQ